MNDFRELCAQNMISPELVDGSKKMFDIVEDNYKKLSYIVFLLNKPVKKEKFNRYKGQNKEILSHSISKEEVLDQNKNAIEEIIDLKKDLK